MRLIFQSFKLAFTSIRSNKMRAFLTMLGMIIGVASVIILTGLVNGVTNYIVESFADMGTNMLSVTVTNTGSRTVEVDDMYALADENGSWESIRYRSFSDNECNIVILWGVICNRNLLRIYAGKKSSSIESNRCVEE